MLLRTLLLFFLVEVSRTLRLEECQAEPLGMESGKIADNQLTASSSFDKHSVGPQNARIRNEKASGAWCPKPQINSNSYEFLQINLDRTYVITAVETQGRFGNGTGREYAAEFMIDYLRPGSKWIRYRNRTGHTFMSGNIDTVTAVIRNLDPPIVASRIRLAPHSKQMRTVCLRAELYGCAHKDGLLYYSTLPEGSRIGEQDFSDPTFEQSDLFTETGIKRGLGALSDGFVANGTPFEKSANGSWIGWNKHHTGGMLTLLFEFDQLRNFSEILFAAFGHRMGSIDVIFSQDGSHFPVSSQISSLDRLAANSTEKRYDVRIPLHKRMARKVRISIKFPGDWLFLTEVHFASGPVVEEPELYDVIANETSVVPQTMDEADFFSENREILITLALLTLLLIFLLIICSVFCLRKQNEKHVYEQDAKRDLIITHLGGKSTTHLFDSTNFGSHLFTSDKTTSTSVSSKSSSSAGKMSPPTWSEFHFPPPPMTPEERIYAEPCSTLPLLPQQRRHNDGSKSLTSKRPKLTHNSDLHYATSDVACPQKPRNFDKIAQSQLLFGQDIGAGKLTIIRECSYKGLRSAYKCARDPLNVQIRKALTDESRCLSSVSHPNVVKLLATDETSALVLELMALGDVRSFLRSTREPAPLPTLLAICGDVCAAMSHLESLGIVHGHLTPSHVLLDENLTAKICSPRGPGHPAQLRYSAPESIISNHFSSRSDAWAFSVVVSEIVEQCRIPPLEHLTNAEIVDNAEKIMSGRDDVVLPLVPEIIPRGLRDILIRCFSAEPECRPTFAQIYPFISRFRS